MKRPALLTALCLALTLGACSRGEPAKAPKEPTAARSEAREGDTLERDWQNVQRALERQASDPFTRLKYLKEFQLHHPGAHKQEVESELEKAQTQADAIRKERATKARRLHQAQATDLERGDLKAMAEMVLFDVSRWTSDSAWRGQPVQLKLTHHGQIRELDRGLYFGLGTARRSLVTQLRTVAPQWVVNDLKKPPAQTANLSLNQLLRPLLGADLFDPDQPGRLHAAPLKKLLGLAALSPEDELLGHSARQLYPLVRRPVEDYLAAYRALVARVGREQARMDLEAALKEHPDSPGEDYNQGMLGFYRDYPARRGLDQDPALQGQAHAGWLVGFWLRRVHDGTDEVLFQFLEQQHQRLSTP